VAGKLATTPKAADAMRRDPPTCSLADPLESARKRAQDSGWDTSLVVNELGVVLGRLSAANWDAKPGTPIESVMEPGPSTFRPDQTVEALRQRMTERKVKSVLVTDPDGVLLGVLYREDL
jgi:CBS domain-containing protein